MHTPWSYDSQRGSSWYLQPGRRDKPFVGTIELELRQGADERDKNEKWIYYFWRLDTPAGEFVWAASNGVSFRVIPDKEEPFQFALLHAVENIQRKRHGRKRVLRVEGYEWIN
ncbi:MAG: hypothetical protein ACREQW_21820 [Candidatus Binatia bacterium]